MTLYNPLNKLTVTLLLILSMGIVTAQATLEETANVLAVIPGDPEDTLLAGTNSGLLFTKNSEWVEYGLADKTIMDMAVTRSSPEIIYAVNDEGELYKAVYAGKDWTTLPVKVDGNNVSIRTITVSPNNESTLMAGSKEGLVLRSVDGGNKWDIINPDFPMTAINAIVLHPSDDNTIFMGTGGNGIFKTSNGGLDWSIMNNGLTDLTVTRLLIDHTDHTLMYAGTYGGGVFKSEDGGQSWAQANNGLEDTFVYSLALSPSRNGDNRILSFLKDQVKHITGNGGSIYIYAGVYGGKIYRSEVKENLEWDPF